MEILPSLISSNLLNLQATLRLLDPYCDGYHLDIMDNHFVPNLTWGSDFVNAISNVTRLPLHVHLMVDRPDTWIARLSLSAQDLFIFHSEVSDSSDYKGEIIAKVRDKGWKVGIAVNPATPIDKIFDILSDLDLVLLMSVQPGFSGQLFMPDATKKVAPLLKLRAEKNLGFKISMDGGINTSNVKMLAQLGVEQVAVASAIFSKSDPVAALEDLYRLAAI